MAEIKILCIGDVVGTPGVKYLSGGRLRQFRDSVGAKLVIVNGENSADSNGINSESANALFDAGADIITGGNHTFKKNSVYQYLDNHCNIIRPANYPSDVHGMGYCITDVDGWRIMVINLLGVSFMEPLDSPFKVVDSILDRERGRFDTAIVDFHAEATSEKICLGRYLDRRSDVSVVFGTHTHVQTADASVFEGGTGYITDLGMTGPDNGVLGVKSECIIHKFIKRTPTKFEIADGPCSSHGALFTINGDTTGFKCVDAQIVKF